APRAHARGSGLTPSIGPVPPRSGSDGPCATTAVARRSALPALLGEERWYEGSPRRPGRLGGRCMCPCARCRPGVRAEGTDAFIAHLRRRLRARASLLGRKMLARRRVLQDRQPRILQVRLLLSGQRPPAAPIDHSSRPFVGPTLAREGEA